MPLPSARKLGKARQEYPDNGYFSDEYFDSDYFDTSDLPAPAPVRKKTPTR